MLANLEAQLANVERIETLVRLMGLDIVDDCEDTVTKGPMKICFPIVH